MGANRSYRRRAIACKRGLQIIQSQLTQVLQGTLFYADGGKSIRKLLDPVQEPIRPELNDYKNNPELGVYDMWQVQGKRTEVCKAYLDRWNQSGGMDAILCMSN